MEATRQQVRKLRVDSLFGKKKHFNAADRKSSLYNWLNIPMLILNAVLASVLLTNLQKTSPDTFKWISASLAITATILAGLNTFLNLTKQAEGHRKIGSKFLAVQKACERILSFEKDGLIDGQQLMTEFKSLALSYQEATSEEATYTPSQEDFDKARKGLSSGEEEYLSSELEF
jgi:hypothetical protein